MSANYLAVRKLAELRPVDEPDDAQLVRRALDGERWAKEALYRRHVHRVMTIAARLLRNRPDVDDVTQDVFVAAFRDLPQLRDPARFRAWISTSTVHHVQKRFRRRKLRRMLGMESPSSHDEALELQASETSSPELRVELRMVDRALDGLSDEDRTAWVLRHLLEYSIVNVAEVTGCSLATANRRLSRAQAFIELAFAEERHD